MLVLALMLMPLAPAPVEAGLGKIDPWVLAATAEGAQAEMLVVLNVQADLSGASALPTKAEKGRYVYDALWRTANDSQTALVHWLTAHGVEHRAFYIVNAVWVRADQETARRLAARAEVARIEGNPAIHLSLPETAILPLTPQMPEGVESNIAYVHANQVWAMGYTGQGIVIGGQDTGYQWDHPALKTHYRGWDGASASHDYNWHDSIHANAHGTNTCGANALTPCDDFGHGTHTMGTAVGDDGGANQIGMAPGAKWMGCRNMNDGTGTPATYLECFEFFLAPYPVSGTPAQGDPAQAPDVTINSWTCPIGPPPSGEGCVTDSLQAAVEAQRAAGIMTVVAAGNSGSACSTISEPPSFYDAAYTVGALNTSTDALASFSGRGPVTADGSNRLKPDIAAPGTNIRSSVPGNGYSSAYSGTSMATPHVAGAVALLWSARPALKNQITLTEQILDDSAFHLSTALCSSSGSWPNNLFGYGRLDVKAAVDLAPAGSGQFVGTVSNALTLAPVVSASVQATIALTPTLTFGLPSDTSGAFNETVFPGVYTVTVTKSGYVSTVLGGVTVSDALTTTQDITLMPLRFYYFPVVLH